MSDNSAIVKYDDVVERAVKNGIERYIASRKLMIHPFTDRNYSFQGSLKIHKKAIGWDLFFVPVNIVWSLVKLLAVFFSFLAGKVGLSYISRKLKHLPPSFETATEKEINWLIYSELLELPFEQGERTSTKDALLDEILNDITLKKVVNDFVGEIRTKQESINFKEGIEKKLQEYGTTRVSSSELASNLLLITSSYATLGRASFGALSAGNLVGASIAHSMAVSNFWLGSTIGGWYYAVISVSVPLFVIIPIIGIVIMLMAIVSTFIGVFIDPLQSKFGWHQKRLLGLIESFQDDLLSKSNNYHLKEKYCSRVFDVLDILSIVAKAAR
jgi:hypothetical protein